MKETKRQNFNITPEQEAEIAHLKEIINASTTKDAILSAVRFYTVMAMRIKEGQEIYMTGKRDNQMEKVMIPDLEILKPPKFKYLIERPHSSSRQLFVKGRRLQASIVYDSMVANKMTPEQTAKNWDLPVEVVYECVDYCKENESLIRMEAEETERWLVAEGYIENPSALR